MLFGFVWLSLLQRADSLHPCPFAPPDQLSLPAVWVEGVLPIDGISAGLGSVPGEVGVGVVGEEVGEVLGLGLESGGGHQLPEPVFLEPFLHSLHFE